MGASISNAGDSGSGISYGGISYARTRWLAILGLAQLILGGAGTAQGAEVHGAVTTSGPTVRTGRRVVLVHGIYDSGWSMRWMKQRLESQGWEVWAISFSPNDASISFEAMARQLETYIRLNVPGDKFDLVGFSMGGLVSRYYVQKLGGEARVRKFVTLSAPNHGTIWAWLSGRVGWKEMRSNSAMLRELNGDTSKLETLGYTSIFTPMDMTIVPAESSRMPGMRNVVVWVPLHPLMVMMREPMRAVERALE